MKGKWFLGIRDQAPTAQGKWYRQKVVGRMRLNPVMFHTTHTRRRRSNRLSQELAKYSYATILYIIIIRPIIIIHGSLWIYTQVPFEYRKVHYSFKKVIYLCGKQVILKTKTRLSQLILWIQKFDDLLKRELFTQQRKTLTWEFV